MNEQLSDQELAAALEWLLFFGPKPSAALRYLDFPGVTVTIGSHPDPNNNRVGLAHLAESEADAVIDNVIAEFQRAGHGFVWYLTPSSLPLDLARRLTERGLSRATDVRIAGLAFSLLPEPSAPGSTTEVRSVDISELRKHVNVMADGYGTPVEHSLATLDRLEAGTAPGFEFVQYLAYENGAPVAMATGMVDHVRKVTLLGGGATLPSHRGRGHYRALVQARVADARAKGSLAVVTHAVRTTSAPILLSLDFREVVSIERHVMLAPTASTGAQSRV
ncbi:MAG: GNAT family N-acetyltransferase [Trueperaceae bacterium]|nr:GNAT family N-acetyltransferase [Trueperaceae bacterium]